jgi:phage terminase small subunit
MGAEKRTKSLTLRQRRFIDEYWKCGIGSKAAVAAGYSKSSARVMSRKLLDNPLIKKALRDREYISKKKSYADRDEILTFFTNVMRGEVKDQFDIEASLSDRLKAGTELAKRVIDAEEQTAETRIVIENNIPKVCGVMTDVDENVQGVTVEVSQKKKETDEEDLEE